MKFIGWFLVSFSWVHLSFIFYIMYCFISNLRILRSGVSHSESISQLEKTVLIISLSALVINIGLLILFRTTENNFIHNALALIPICVYVLGKDDIRNNLIRKTKVGESTIDYTMPNKFIIKALKYKVFDLNANELKLFKTILNHKTTIEIPDEYEDEYSDISIRYRTAKRLCDKNLATLNRIDYDNYILKIDENIIPYISYIKNIE